MFDTVYPQTHSEARAASATILALDEVEPVQTLRHVGVGAVLESFDRRALLRLAVAKAATLSWW